MAEAIDAEFPSLFRHRARLDWGVSVLAGERDGKRRYFFEDGEERTMAAAHLHLMQKVEAPDRSQQTTYAQLMALLSKRGGREPPAGPQGTKALMAQLEKFRREYPAGFCGEAWQGAARKLRQLVVREAPALGALSATSLEALASSHRLESAWDSAQMLCRESGLVGKDPGTPAGIDQRRLMGEAVRDLLHGQELFERRFDHFVTRYEIAFQTAPSWQVATALPALIAPVEHVCVEPTSFKNQLKALSLLSTLTARPSGKAYLRCQSMARALASALAAQGEMPVDFLDVQAFIRATAQPPRRASS